MAVLAVVAFHAGFGAPGGFVGVDVFFVISGYLVGSILLRELAAQTFSLRRFWLRRIRRIAPAQYFVVIFVLMLGWLILIPSDFRALGDSAVWQAAMAGNIYFWQQTGYFQPAAQTQPLLHYWSLAVEEQFYVVFPLILLVTQKLSSRWQLFAYGALFTGSLELCLYAAANHPSANFFWMPTRFWELMVGFLLARYCKGPIQGRWVAEALAITGFAAIMGCIFFYNDALTFPGLLAIPPVLGAAAIVAGTSNRSTWLNRLLSRSWLVGIGLISYSLYLWHWPLLVYANYVSVLNPSPILRLAAVVLSFGLAYLSWRFVEVPIRNRQLFSSPRQLLAGMGSVALVTVVLAVGTYLPHAQPWVSAQMREFDDNVTETRFRHEVTVADIRNNDLPRLGEMESDPPAAFIWGDSHAMAALPAIDRVFRERGLSGIAFTHSNTAPLPDFADCNELGLSEDQSLLAAEVVLEKIQVEQIKHVILVAKWSGYLQYSQDGLTRGDFETGIRELISRLRRFRCHVWIMSEVPLQRYEDLPRRIAIASRWGSTHGLGIPAQQHTQRVHSTLQLLRSLARDGVTVLDPLPYFITDDGLTRVTLRNHSVYTDSNHLSVAGSRLLDPLFRKVAEQIENGTAEEKGKDTQVLDQLNRHGPVSTRIPSGRSSWRTGVCSSLRSRVPGRLLAFAET